MSHAETLRNIADACQLRDELLVEATQILRDLLPTCPWEEEDRLNYPEFWTTMRRVSKAVEKIDRVGPCRHF